jgi:hypothetical protein
MLPGATYPPFLSALAPPAFRCTGGLIAGFAIRWVKKRKSYEREGDSLEIPAGAPFIGRRQRSLIVAVLGTRQICGLAGCHVLFQQSYIPQGQIQVIAFRTLIQMLLNTWKLLVWIFASHFQIYILWDPVQKLLAIQFFVPGEIDLTDPFAERFKVHRHLPPWNELPFY